MPKTEWRERWNQSTRKEREEMLASKEFSSKWAGYEYDDLPPFMQQVVAVLVK